MAGSFREQVCIKCTSKIFFLLSKFLVISWLVTFDLSRTFLFSIFLFDIELFKFRSPWDKVYVNVEKPFCKCLSPQGKIVITKKLGLLNWFLLNKYFFSCASALNGNFRSQFRFFHHRLNFSYLCPYLLFQ